MLSLALALAHPLLMATPSPALNRLDAARFDNDCFAFAVSYSVRGERTRRRSERSRSHRRHRAAVTNVIRYSARRDGTCHREESAIRDQFDRALTSPGTRHSAVDYTAPVVYTYARARTAHRRRAQVIDRIERNWRIVQIQFRYLPRISERNLRRRWRNGRPGLEWDLARLPIPSRVNPRAPVRIVRRRGGS